MSLERKAIKQIIAKYEETHPKDELTYNHVKWVRKKHGITRRVRDSMKRKAEQWLDDGWSASEIARTLGVWPSTVLDWFPGRGWTMQQIHEYQAALVLTEWNSSWIFHHKPKNFAKAHSYANSGDWSKKHV